MAPGDVLGRFRLIEVVLDYEFGEIWLARDPDGAETHVDVEPDTAVALRAPSEALADLTVSERIAHPNLVPVLDAGADVRCQWFAIEAIEGLRLPALTDGLRRGGRVVPPWTVAYIVHAVGSALSAIHKSAGSDGRPVGTLGGPLHPAHIGLTSDGAVRLAVLPRQHPAPRTDLPLSPYRSPESLQSDALGTSSDVFGLGIIAWELLAERPLFGGLKPQQRLQAIRTADVPPLPSTVPELLVAATVGCLARRPDERYESVDIVVDMLDDALRLRPEASVDEARRLVALAGRLWPFR